MRQWLKRYPQRRGATRIAATDNGSCLIGVESDQLDIPRPYGGAVLKFKRGEGLFVQGVEFACEIRTLTLVGSLSSGLP